jgi:hypothetical protein
MIASSLFFSRPMSPARGPLVHKIRLAHAHLQLAKWNAYGSYRTIEVLKYCEQAEVAKFAQNSFTA